jgi:mannitol-1-/sugar-/sorbitol-6-/2-deoxyglucose-6-phosphatase
MMAGNQITRCDNLIKEEVNIFAAMQLDTVIFDMDGLLIDSEPIWGEAADEIFKQYGFSLTKQQHASTTGMRVQEFVLWWFGKHHVPEVYAAKAGAAIIQVVIDKVQTKGKAMPGLGHIFNFFIDRKYKIGLASSSPMILIDVVVDKLGIRKYLHAIASAADMPNGKPHPQVYLDCAAQLQSHPLSCICFEDSFNGLIAAKAARMKCVVVPSQHDSKDSRFNAADLKISSLLNFNELLMQTLQ